MPESFGWNGIHVPVVALSTLLSLLIALAFLLLQHTVCHVPLFLFLRQ